MPEHQGMGIASAMKEYIAKQYASKGKVCINKTSNPQMISILSKNENWVLLKKGRNFSHNNNISNKTIAKNRFTASFKYIPK